MFFRWNIRQHNNKQVKHFKWFSEVINIGYCIFGPCQPSVSCYKYVKDLICEIHKHIKSTVGNEENTFIVQRWHLLGNLTRKLYYLLKVITNLFQMTVCASNMKTVAFYEKTISEM
jgi:hypothetical protein